MGANIRPKSPFSLRAEVFLLLIITIFGIIGLSFCIRMGGQSDNISARLDPVEEIHEMSYDRPFET